MVLRAGVMPILLSALSDGTFLDSASTTMRNEPFSNSSCVSLVTMTEKMRWPRYSSCTWQLWMSASPARSSTYPLTRGRRSYARSDLGLTNHSVAGPGKDAQLRSFSKIFVEAADVVPRAEVCDATHVRGRDGRDGD